MRRALLLLLLLLAPGLAAAQEVRVTAGVDARRVGLDDTVDLTLTIEGPAQLAADVGLPPLRNLSVVGGPSVSTQIAFVNGAMSQSRVYRWTLRPYSTGRAQVGALTVRLQGGDQTTEVIPIEVVAGSVKPRRRAPNPADPFSRFFGADPAGTVRGRADEPKLRVEVQPSRQRLHVGEALVLTYVLFTQASISDLQFTAAPEYPGFWSEELPKPDTPPGGEPVELQGERYRRFPFLKRLLFPTRAGRLAIPPVTLRMQIPGSLFEPGQSVQRATQALAVEALPLPEEPGATGAVGRFEVSAAVEPSRVALGEAATLRLAVTGVGNLKWVEKGPEVVVPGARVYPPQVADNLRPTDGGLAGTRTWSYVVVPETAGTLDVPALTFSWFDPVAGRTASASTAPQALQVAPSAGSSSAPPGTASRERGGLALRSDLDAAPAWLAPLGGRAVGLLLGAAAALHLLVFAGFGLLDRRARQSGHAARGAVRSAVSELQDVARGGRTKEEAAALVEQALQEAFGDVDALEGDGERERTVRQLHQEVQFIRYAPQLGEYADRIRDLAKRAEQAVRRWA